MTEDKQNSIPAVIMDALSSPEVTRTVQEIGTTLHLHVDQQGEFIDLVTDLILGVTQWEAFKTTLKRDFALTDEQYTYAVGEVEKKVLAPIGDALHQLYEQSTTEAQTTEQEAVQGTRNEGEQSATVTPNPYRSVDPYREPID